MGTHQRIISTACLFRHRAWEEESVSLKWGEWVVILMSLKGRTIRSHISLQISSSDSWRIRSERMRGGIYSKISCHIVDRFSRANLTTYSPRLSHHISMHETTTKSGCSKQPPSGRWSSCDTLPKDYTSFTRLSPSGYATSCYHLN